MSTDGTVHISLIAFVFGAGHFGQIFDHIYYSLSVSRWWIFVAAYTQKGPLENWMI